LEVYKAFYWKSAAVRVIFDLIQANVVCFMAAIAKVLQILNPLSYVSLQEL
jgi:hypothetical protein